MTVESDTNQDGLAIWKRLETTDRAYTKDFKRSGGFQGTAINPTYCYRKLTEVFGPIGFGWRVEEVKSETFNFPSDIGVEVVLYKTIHLFVKLDGEWSAPIIGNGGEYIISYVKPQPAKDGRPAREGYFAVDDESHKKCFTDALTNAMKMLGMSADVHMGQYDDNKYVNASKSKADHQGPISEFAFAIKKRSSEPPYGHPAEYWDKWDRAIKSQRARKIKKKFKNGEEVDAWEVDSLDEPPPDPHTEADRKAEQDPGNQVRRAAPTPDPNAATQDEIDRLEREREAVALRKVVTELLRLEKIPNDFFIGWFGSERLPQDKTAYIEPLAHLKRVATNKAALKMIATDPKKLGENMAAIADKAGEEPAEWDALENQEKVKEPEPEPERSVSSKDPEIILVLQKHNQTDARSILGLVRNNKTTLSMTQIKTMIDERAGMVLDNANMSPDTAKAVTAVLKELRS